MSRIVSLFVVLATLICTIFSDSCAAIANPPQLGPGRYVQSIVVGSLVRDFIVYVPQSYAFQPTPLVFNFHGGGSTDVQQELISKMDINSEQNGYIVVYPNAVDKHWNDGRIIPGVTNYPDLQFVQALVPFIESELNIDTKRVYSCGFSDGSFFTERLAFQMPQTFAAVGMVAGDLLKVLLGDFGNAHTPPMPIMLFHGTLDPFVPFNGGYVISFVNNNERAGKVYAAFFTNLFWAGHNFASTNPIIQVLPIVDPNNPTSAVKYTYPGQFPVVFFEEIGAGHTWPDGLQYLPVSKVGETCRQINADEELWQFFKQFHKP